ncbi:MAG: 3TM-type holin [Campylobacterales bacterium]
MGSILTDMIGGALGDTVSKIGDTVKKFVTTDADRLALDNELEKIKAEAKQRADEIGIQYEQIAAKNAEDINKTMQSEAASEHMPTYLWRPFIGFVFGLMGLILAITVAVAYISVMLGHSKPEVLTHLPQMLISMTGVMAVISPILGVASWFRGKMQADPNIPTVNRG